MADHNIFVRFGDVSTPAEPNKNPSVAQSPGASSGKSPTGNAVNTAVLIQGAKQIMDSSISNIGFVTGNYELQGQIESAITLAGIGVGLYVAPIPTLIALSIKTGFDAYTLNIRKQREQYQQQQNQILTGKVSVNGGRY